MTQEIVSNAHEKDTATSVRARPRAREYFWRPWYAKLWWSLAFIFWLVVLFDAIVLRFLPRVDGGWQIWVVMLFHPFVIAPVLAFAFVRDWLEFSGFYDLGNDGPVEGLYDGANGMGFEGPIDDPMNPNDPRFNMLPANPGSPAWRERHVWGGD